MLRKYLKKTLEIRAGAKKNYVYNENGDLVRTHESSYTQEKLSGNSVRHAQGVQ